MSCRVVSATEVFVILRIFREWHASSEPQQSNLTGEPHVALVPNQGWTLFSADGSPIARFGDEDRAKQSTRRTARPCRPCRPCGACGMSKTREHIVIEPSAGSIDFQRKDYDATQVWFSHPRPAWWPNVIPAAIAAACGGDDITISTFRRFPMRDPADFTISNEGAFLTRVFMPIGGTFSPTLWTCLTWHSARQAPVTASERFHITGNGLKRLLTDLLMNPETIDKLRKLDSRPRTEVLVRHDWRALDIAPGCIDLPGWMQKIGDLTGAEAAAKMNAMRAPTSAAEWHRLHAQDRAEKERKRIEEEGLALYVPNQPDAEPQVEAVADASTVEIHVAPQAPAEPYVMPLEERKQRRATKAKLARSTRSKVAADAKDKIAAKAHADKVVARMERAGQL